MGGSTWDGEFDLTKCFSFICGQRLGDDQQSQDQDKSLNSHSHRFEMGSRSKIPCEQNPGTRGWPGFCRLMSKQAIGVLKIKLRRAERQVELDILLY